MPDWSETARLKESGRTVPDSAAERTRRRPPKRSAVDLMLGRKAAELSGRSPPEWEQIPILIRSAGRLTTAALQFDSLDCGSWPRSCEEESWTGNGWDARLVLTTIAKEVS